MNQFITQGIILSRTDYGEADRIIKFLTPNHGKLTAMAKGVRKSKSKLAGGIELFSISDLTLIEGRSEIQTLISTRLVDHYDSIVKDLDRTTAGYELIGTINKATADNPEPAYFELLKISFEALNNTEIDPKTTLLWFNMQIIKLAGHQPNLYTDRKGNKLTQSKDYGFDFDNMCFSVSETAKDFNAEQIKFLRLGFAAENPHVLSRVKEESALTSGALSFIKSLALN